MTMAWSATANMGYILSPSSGTLEAGQQQTVSVTNVLPGTGTVTVTAPMAQNSPQQVTITCTA
jgi:hypothetical protein